MVVYFLVKTFYNINTRWCNEKKEKIGFKRKEEIN